LEKRAEQVLPGSKGGGEEGGGVVCVCVGKMAETVYAHMNKVNKQFKKKKERRFFFNNERSYTI
jgi:hypothetical protein